MGGENARRARHLTLVRFAHAPAALGPALAYGAPGSPGPARGGWCGGPGLPAPGLVAVACSSREPYDHGAPCLPLADVAAGHRDVLPALHDLRSIDRGRGAHPSSALEGQAYVRAYVACVQKGRSSSSLPAGMSATEGGGAAWYPPCSRAAPTFSIRLPLRLRKYFVTPSLPVHSRPFT